MVVPEINAGDIDGHRGIIGGLPTARRKVDGMVRGKVERAVGIALIITLVPESRFSSRRPWLIPRSARKARRSLEAMLRPRNSWIFGVSSGPQVFRVQPFQHVRAFRGA